MAINLDKANQLYNASMSRPISQNTCPMVIERVVKLNITSPTDGVNPNPSLGHTNFIPFTNWNNNRLLSDSTEPINGDSKSTNKSNSQNSIRLFIKTVMGRAIACNVIPHITTLRDLKQMIHESEQGLPHHLIKLKRATDGIEIGSGYSNQVDVDSKTMKELGYDYDIAVGDPNKVTLVLIHGESKLWR